MDSEEYKRVIAEHESMKTLLGDVGDKEFCLIVYDAKAGIMSAMNNDTMTYDRRAKILYQALLKTQQLILNDRSK